MLLGNPQTSTNLHSQLSPRNRGASVVSVNLNLGHLRCLSRLSRQKNKERGAAVVSVNPSLSHLIKLNHLNHLSRQKKREQEAAVVLVNPDHLRSKRQNGERGAAAEVVRLTNGSGGSSARVKMLGLSTRIRISMERAMEGAMEMPIEGGKENESKLQVAPR